MIVIMMQIKASIDRGESTVYSCSGLKKVYRDIIREGEKKEEVKRGAIVRFIYLKGSKELIAERVTKRQGHFMNKGLLDSQVSVSHPNIIHNISFSSPHSKNQHQMSMLLLLIFLNRPKMSSQTFSDKSATNKVLQSFRVSGVYL